MQEKSLKPETQLDFLKPANVMSCSLVVMIDAHAMDSDKAAVFNAVVGA